MISIPLNISWQMILWSMLTLLGAYLFNKMISYFIRRIGTRRIDLIPGKGEKYVEISGRELRQIARFVGYVIYGFAVMIVLGILGVNPMMLATGMGVAGIAVGFAAKDLLANFLSGIFLLFERTYGVDDVIKIGDTYGIVRSVKLRSTQIKTFDGNLVSIPNSKIASSEVINMTSGSDQMLSSVWAKVSYDEDIQKVKKLMVDAAKQVDGVYLDGHQKPMFEVNEIGKRYWGLKIIMHFPLKAREEPWIKSGVQEKVNEALVKNGVSFHQEAQRP